MGAEAVPAVAADEVLACVPAVPAAAVDDEDSG